MNIGTCLKCIIEIAKQFVEKIEKVYKIVK